MGNTTSSPLQTCLTSAVGSSNVAFPSAILYQATKVRPYNLDIPITPAAVTFPTTADQVAAIVKCATNSNLKVQPRGGGHSYANYCLGGVSGAVVVDMSNFKQFSMDNTTWQATIGSGYLLQDVTNQLNAAGGRAMAHGVCPQVGIGGHATIGGLGPSSRMWGSALDHVLEVEVVLANATVTRASATQNPDLFFALKGAGASFGIITEFIVRTEPAPGQAIVYSYALTKNDPASMAQTFKNWQALVSNPSLTRKFASQVNILPIGMIITGTFFGTQAEFDALNLTSVFPHGFNGNTTVITDWLGLVANWAENLVLEGAGGLPAHFYSKSIAFKNTTLIPSAGVDALFNYIGSADKGTIAWFLIFDLSGGAVGDVPISATAYPHRDVLYFLQTYTLNPFGTVTDTEKAFLNGINNVIQQAVPGVNFLSYAGYVDPALPNGPSSYWGPNLPKLEQIKKAVDPNDVFQNPQSVQLAS